MSKDLKIIKKMMQVFKVWAIAVVIPQAPYLPARQGVGAVKAVLPAFDMKQPEPLSYAVIT